MKQITRILVTVSVLLILFQIDGVFAEAQTTAAKWQSVTDAAIEILNFIIGVFGFIMSPFIALAGWLLSPDWTMGDIFGLRSMLHKFWVTISNITYFIYAIALIVMALASMFNVENYGVKKLLPKFALGILMVPMTWWFVQATVSLANILTVSVIQIPFETLKSIQGGGGQTWLTTKSIPSKIEYNENNTWSKLTATDCKKDQWSCLSLEDVLAKPSSWPFSMLNVFAYNIFRIQDVKVIGEDDAKLIKNGVNILNKLIYGVIMFVAFGIIIIALIAALFKRAILLWVYAIFSPLFSLAFFLPDGLKKWLDLFDYKKFIGLAFVPVYVAGAMAFWLVLLNLIVNPLTTAATACSWADFCISNIMGDTSSKFEAKKEWTDWIKSTWNVAWMEIIHVGTINKWTSSGDAPRTLSDSIFGTIIFDILWILILWTAVIWALKWSALTANLVWKFEDFGKQAGGMWKYAPLPGIPGGSIHGMNQWAQMAMNAPKKAADKRFNESNFWQAVNRMNGVSPGDISSNARIKELASKIKDWSQANTTEVVNAVDWVRSASQNWLNAIANGMRDIASKLWKSDDIQGKMLEWQFLKDYWGIKSKESLQENLKLMSEWKLPENSAQFKAITAAFAGLERGSLDIKQAKDVLWKLDTPRGSSTDNQQTNTSTGPQPTFDKQSQILNMNNTNINLGKLGTDADEQARLERVANEVNKQYSWDPKDLEKLLKDLKIPDSEAEKISKKVTEIRNNTPKK